MGIKFFTDFIIFNTGLSVPQITVGSMYWTVLLKISATALLLTAGLLTIPHALLGATLKHILFGAAAVSGVITALSAFKLISVNKTHSESKANRINSETEMASKDHSDGHGND